jgi:hypothetical protein
LLCYLVLDATNKGTLRGEIDAISVPGEDTFDAVLGIGRACFDRDGRTIPFAFSDLLQESDNLAGGVLAQDEYRYPFSLGHLKDPRATPKVRFGGEDEVSVGDVVC